MTVSCALITSTFAPRIGSAEVMKSSTLDAEPG